MRNIFGNSEKPETTARRGKDEGKERGEDINTGKKTGVFRTLSRNFERRVKSELFLEESLPWHFNPGEAYHCFFIWRCGRAYIFTGYPQTAAA